MIDTDTIVAGMLTCLREKYIFTSDANLVNKGPAAKQD